MIQDRPLVRSFYMPSMQKLQYFKENTRINLNYFTTKYKPFNLKILNLKQKKMSTIFNWRDVRMK